MKTSDWLTPRDPQCPNCGKTFITIEKAARMPKGTVHSIKCDHCDVVHQLEVND